MSRRNLPILSTSHEREILQGEFSANQSGSIKQKHFGDKRKGDCGVLERRDESAKAATIGGTTCM